tara:strand:+ start:936 stop:1931 length:996 start_codon:yes stop_codon:yes gene_type:complete
MVLPVGPMLPDNSPWNGGTPLTGVNSRGFHEPDSYQKMFRNRYLPERSRIEFHYGGQDNTIVFLPFYENPRISESQTANYADYNPVGRAGSLYAYLGSKSRTFKVEMTYTLPHLAMHEMGINRFMRVFANGGPQSEKALFTKKAKFSSNPVIGDANKSLSLAVKKAYSALINDANTTVTQPNGTGSAFLSDFGNSTPELLASMNPDESSKVLDTLLFFVAVLRTSVVNNASDPMQGPPLLRLTFGTLYQSIPCICKQYSLKYEEDTGYDLETLTPRRIKVNLTLEEIRVGDFQEYSPAVMTQRDNLTGWESAINSPYTVDPLPAAGYWADS